MELIAILCGNGLIISLLLNVFLYLRLKKKSQKQDSYELKDFLQDMLGGHGLVKVTRIAPGDVFVRRPHQ